MNTGIDTCIPRSSFELGQLELQKSPMYEKMSTEQRAYYVSHSLALGKEAAQQLQECPKTIFQLLEEQHIQVTMKPTSKYSGAFILRGDIHFTQAHCEITVYEDSVHSIYRGGELLLPKDLILTQKQAVAVHLSHEFFHYLEFQSGKTVSQRLEKLHVPGLFKRMRQVEVVECSEIAAHAFAKQFCQLQVLPNYYDVHYLYQRNETMT